MTIEQFKECVLSEDHSAFGISIYKVKCESDFKDWFKSKAVYYSSSDGQIETALDSERQKEPGLCYANARSSLTFGNLKYVEGFYHVTGHKYMIAPHAFNLDETTERVHDYTAFGQEYASRIEFYGGIVFEQTEIDNLLEIAKRLGCNYSERSQLSLVVPLFYYQKNKQDAIREWNFRMPGMFE